MAYGLPTKIYGVHSKPGEKTDFVIKANETFIENSIVLLKNGQGTIFPEAGLMFAGVAESSSPCELVGTTKVRVICIGAHPFKIAGAVEADRGRVVYLDVTADSQTGTFVEPVADGAVKLPIGVFYEFDPHGIPLVKIDDYAMSQKVEVVNVLVNVLSVTLNKASTSIAVDADETLVATVLPADADVKSLTWTSSDETKATVDNTGKVTGIAAGEATITVATIDGNKTDDCVVTVTA